MVRARRCPRQHENGDDADRDRRSLGELDHPIGGVAGAAEEDERPGEHREHAANDGNAQHHAPARQAFADVVGQQMAGQQREHRHEHEGRVDRAAEFRHSWHEVIGPREYRRVAPSA